MIERKRKRTGREAVRKEGGRGRGEQQGREVRLGDREAQRRRGEKDERDSRVPEGMTFREKNHQKGHLLMFILYITINI